MQNWILSKSVDSEEFLFLMHLLVALTGQNLPWEAWYKHLVESCSFPEKENVLIVTVVVLLNSKMIKKAINIYKF